MTFALLIMVLLLMCCEAMTIMYLYDHEQRLREVERKIMQHDTEISIFYRTKAL